jgi:hypothetical protein
MEFKFEKHKYTVECITCGDTQINDDSGVATVVQKVTVSFCQKCCPEGYSGAVTQICYDANNHRITDER